MPNAARHANMALPPTSPLAGLPRIQFTFANKSSQAWGHTPELRVAASTLRRYSFGLRLAIAQAVARPALRMIFR